MQQLSAREIEMVSGAGCGPVTAGTLGGALVAGGVQGGLRGGLMGGLAGLGVGAAVGVFAAGITYSACIFIDS